jgi:hypothetical protein
LARGDAAHQLALARGQLARADAGGRPRLSQRLGGLAQPGADEPFAAQDRPDRRVQLLGARHLDHVAVGARGERLQQVLAVGVHREHEEPRGRQLRGQDAQRLEAGAAGHRQVEDHEVRGGPERQVDQLAAVGGRGDRELVGEQAHERLEEERVIVGEDDARLGLVGRLGVRGLRHAGTRRPWSRA